MTNAWAPPGSEGFVIVCTVVLPGPVVVWVDPGSVVPTTVVPGIVVVDVVSGPTSGCPPATARAETSSSRPPRPIASRKNSSTDRVILTSTLNGSPLYGFV